MPWRNTSRVYGTLTKTFHWLIVLLFLNQYLVANTMVRVGADESFLGLSQGALYNWHKSIGLIALGIALIRYTWRKTNRLPNWAKTLQPWEKRLIHSYERLLYGAMFIMPLSGYLFVESGGYGVNFFGLQRLPTFLPRSDGLALTGEIIHVITGYAIVIALTLHIGLVAKHQLVDRDGILYRMWPGRGQG